MTLKSDTPAQRIVVYMAEAVEKSRADGLDDKSIAHNFIMFGVSCALGAGVPANEMELFVTRAVRVGVATVLRAAGRVPPGDPKP